MIYKIIKQILFRELRIICPACTQPMLVEVIPGSIISIPSKA